MPKTYTVYMQYKNNPTFVYRVEDITKSAAVRRAIRFYAAIILENGAGFGKKTKLNSITPQISVTEIRSQ